MLTPQEVSERSFAKSALGGYNMAMVDDFLDVLTADYTALYNETAVLKSKMKVLVDKVEEYRSTEEAMRKALMTAQRMADQLVAEAEDKKQALLRDAEREAEERARWLTQQTEQEEARLAAAQNATAAYVEQVRRLHQQNLDYLNNLDKISPVSAQPVPVSQEEEAVREIEDSVQRILEAQLAAIRQEPAEEESVDPMEQTAEFSIDREPSLFDEPEIREDEPEDEDQTRVIHRDFGRLEFGRDYEIK